MLLDFWLKCCVLSREIMNLFYIYSGVKQCILNKTSDFLTVNKHNTFTSNHGEDTPVYFLKRGSSFPNPYNSKQLNVNYSQTRSRRLR